VIYQTGDKYLHLQLFNKTPYYKAIMLWKKKVRAPSIISNFVLFALMNHEIIHKDEINHYGFQMTAKLQFVEENDLGD